MGESSPPAEGCRNGGVVFLFHKLWNLKDHLPLRVLLHRRRTCIVPESKILPPWGSLHSKRGGIWCFHSYERLAFALFQPSPALRATPPWAGNPKDAPERQRMANFFILPLGGVRLAVAKRKRTGGRIPKHIID